MNAGGKYNIDLLKVKTQKTFEFFIDNSFFEGFEESSIKNGEINVTVTLDRTNNTFPTVIEAEGKVKIECDRCLNLIDFPLKGKLELIVKLTDQHKEDEDEIVYVMSNEAVFNVSQHIYDMAYLSLPLRKTCQEANIAEGCDQKVIEKLNHLGDDIDNTNDPRWDKLKDLLE